jgi:Mn2+/Fe2+ NRAMP family transporter
MFLPSLSIKREYLAALIAVLGTTISPFLLFWQSVEEVELMQKSPDEQTLKKAPTQAPAQLLFRDVVADAYLACFPSYGTDLRT